MRGDVRGKEKTTAVRRSLFPNHPLKYAPARPVVYNQVSLRPARPFFSFSLRFRPSGKRSTTKRIRLGIGACFSGYRFVRKDAEAAWSKGVRQPSLPPSWIWPGRFRRLGASPRSLTCRNGDVARATVSSFLFYSSSAPYETAD